MSAFSHLSSVFIFLQEANIISFNVSKFGIVENALKVLSSFPVPDLPLTGTLTKGKSVDFWVHKCYCITT